MPIDYKIDKSFAVVVFVSLARARALLAILKYIFTHYVHTHRMVTSIYVKVLYSVKYIIESSGRINKHTRLIIMLSSSIYSIIFFHSSSSSIFKLFIECKLSANVFDDVVVVAVHVNPPPFVLSKLSSDRQIKYHT